MDELIIDDKKYISSKQAAKITGYAKDYVGQLCREGYVEARRVGRSWYVLESAIKDHKFGDVTPGKATTGFTLESAPVATEVAPLTKTWEPPRYEPIVATELSSINLLRSVEPIILARSTEQPGQTQDFHEAWQTWFDTFKGSQGEFQGVEEHKPLTLEKEPEYAHPIPEQGEEQIPIHVLPVPIEAKYAPPSPLPKRTTVLETRIEDVMPRHRASQEHRARMPQIALVIGLSIVGLICGALTLVGTGYFDETIISFERGQYLSGIIIYNK